MGFIVELGLLRFVEGLDVGVREGELGIVLKFLVWIIRRMNLLFIETGNVGGEIGLKWRVGF